MATNDKKPAAFCVFVDFGIPEYSNSNWNGSGANVWYTNDLSEARRVAADMRALRSPLAPEPGTLADPLCVEVQVLRWKPEDGERGHAGSWWSVGDDEALPPPKVTAEVYISRVGHAVQVDFGYPREGDKPAAMLSVCGKIAAAFAERRITTTSSMPGHLRVVVHFRGIDSLADAAQVIRSATASPGSSTGATAAGRRKRTQPGPRSLPARSSSRSVAWGIRFEDWDDLFRNYNVRVTDHGTDEHGAWWEVVA